MGDNISLTWIDLGLWARLIATTKKSAKGESVCSKTFRPWTPLASRVFCCRAPPFAGCWRCGMSSGTLCGREGALVCVSISVDPRHLESLLEALSQVSFPINPQIYHDAALVYRFADDHEESEATTLVEFPAYEGQLTE